MADFIAYYRVSNDRQGASGLGLEAQRAAVLRHIATGQLAAEYTEVESGEQHTNRPQLLAALQECRRRKATLVIAKLDRLGRNVAFISALMESGADFVCCDNPHANRLMLHMLAPFAEHELRADFTAHQGSPGRSEGARREARQPAAAGSPQACKRRTPRPQARAGSAEYHAQPGRAGDELPRHRPRIEPAEYKNRQGLPVVRRDGKGCTRAA